MLNRNVAGRVDVGRIDLMQSFSFFECPEEYTEEILTGMDGVNYKGRQVHVEVAESRSSEGDTEPKEQPAKERKPRARAEKKPERRGEKSRKESKPYREDKPRHEEKPYKKDKPKSSGKIERHSAQRAPQVQIAQDERFWRDFEDDGDWRSFFRNSTGKPKRKKRK